ncbi:MAG: hypothetical protein ACRER2_05885, partial [Methylococcales bacterium]
MIIKRFGAAALSPFRLRKLLSELQNVEPRILAVQARHVYYIDAVREVGPAELTRLDNLLDYGEAVDARDFSEHDRVVFVPRHGTISPWSSKATEIASRCGLDWIARIERGCVFSFSL